MKEILTDTFNDIIIFFEFSHGLIVFSDGKHKPNTVEEMKLVANHNRE